MRGYADINRQVKFDSDRPLRQLDTVQDGDRQGLEVAPGISDRRRVAAYCAICGGKVVDRLAHFLGHGDQAAVVLELGEAIAVVG